MRLEDKSVTIVANPVVGERCHVFLLDTYISKLPPAAVEKDIFHCKPLSNVPTSKNSMVFTCSSWKKFTWENGTRYVF